METASKSIPHKDVARTFSLRLDRDKASHFVLEAIKGNKIYNRERKHLWDLFTDAIDPRGEVSITTDAYTAIEGALCCRNDQLKSEARLAFSTVVMDLCSALGLFKKYPKLEAQCKITSGQVLFEAQGRRAQGRQRTRERMVDLWTRLDKLGDLFRDQSVREARMWKAMTSQTRTADAWAYNAMRVETDRLAAEWESVLEELHRRHYVYIDKPIWLVIWDRPDIQVPFEYTALHFIPLIKEVWRGSERTAYSHPGPLLHLEAQMKRVVNTFVGAAAEEVNRKTSETLNTVMPVLEKKADQFTEKLDQAATMLQGSIAGVAAEMHDIRSKGVKITHDVSDRLMQMIEGLKTFVTNMSSSLDTSGSSIARAIETVIGILSSIYSFCRTNQVDVKVGIMLSLGTLTHSFTTAAEHLVKILDFTDYLQAVKAGTGVGFEAQAGGRKLKIENEEAEAENVFLSFTHILCNAFNFTKPKDWKLEVARITRLKAYASAFKLAHDVYDYVISLITESFNWIYELIYGVPFVQDEAKNTLQLIVTFVSEVEPLLKSDIMEQAKQDFSLCHTISDLVDRGIAIEKLILSVPTLQGHFNSFFTVLSQLKHLNTELNIYRRSNRSRKPPVWFHFWGPPGSGKSNICQFLAKFFLESLGHRNDTHHIFSRNPSTKFMDGYRNQLVAINDDCWQMDLPELRATIAGEMIQMKNDSPMHMNMAAIEDKKMTQFTSELLLTTGNVPDVPRGIALQDPAALLRRRDKVYFVVTKRTLAKETISKLTSPASGIVCEQDPIFNPDEWVFFESQKVYNLDEGPKVTSVPLTLHEVCVEMMMEFYRQRQKVDDVMKRFMANPTFYLETINRLNDRLRREGLKDPEIHVPSPMERGASKDPIDPLDTSPLNLRAQCKWTPSLDKLELCEFGKKEKGETDKEKFDNCLFSRPCAVVKEGDHYSVQVLHRSFADLKLKTGEYYHRLLDVASKNRKGLCVVGGILAAMGAVAALVGLGLTAFRAGSVLPDEEEEMHGESYLGRVTSEQRRFTRAKNFRQQRKFVAQSKVRAMAPIRDHVIGPNMYVLKTVDKDGGIWTCGGFFLCSRLFFTVAHQWNECSYDRIWLQRPGGKAYEILKKDLIVVADNDHDVVFVSIEDKTFPMQKTVIHHFIKEEDTALHLGQFLSMYTVSDGTLRQKTVVKTRWTDEISYSVTALDKKITCSDILLSRGETEYGDCTGIYVTHNTKIPRPLVAYHVGGGSGYAAACLMTQEVIHQAIAEIVKLKAGMRAQARLDYKVLPVEGNEDKLPFPLPKLKGNNVHVVGIASPGHSLPSRSQIRKSPVCGLFAEPKELPAVLSPRKQPDGTTIYPCEKGFLKTDKIKVENCDRALLRACTKALLDQIPTVIDPRVLSPNEAVLGIQGAEYLGPLNRTTSCAYPLNELPGKQKGKTEYIPLDKDGIPYVSDVLLAMMRECESDAVNLSHQEMRAKYPFCVNMKDERLPLRKIYDLTKTPDPWNTAPADRWWASETRVMQSCSLPLLCVSRQYNGAWGENLMASHLHHWCTVGINPASQLEWSTLYHDLNRFGGEFCGDGDLKHCDASTQRVLADEYHWAREQWYKRNPGYSIREGAVRQGLHDATQSGRFVLGSLVYEVDFGNPSGDLNTTWQNSFVISLLILYCAAVRMRELGIRITPHDLLFLHLVIRAFGDDHVYAMSRALAKVFGGTHIARIALEHFGMVYTSADKDQPLLDHRPLSEVTFLGRRFVLRHGLVFAPLDKEILEDAPNWVSIGTLTPEECTEAVLDSNLREWMHHGIEEFEYRKTIINRALDELDLDRNGLTYHQCLAAYLDATPCEVIDEILDLQEEQYDELDDVLEMDVVDSLVDSDEESIMKTYSDVELVAQSAVTRTITRPLRRGYNYCLGKVVTSIDETLFPKPVYAPAELADPYSTARMDLLMHSVDKWERRRQFKKFVKGFCFGYVATTALVVGLGLLMAQSEPKETVTRMEQQQVTNPQSSQSTPTVTFGDNTGTETPALTHKVTIPRSFVGTDPYDDQGLKAVLSRPYLVKTITWSGASTVGALASEFHFPDLLIQVPNIAEKLNRFQFFRASTKVTIRINGTSFHMGALLASWCPHYKKGTNLNYGENIYRASCMENDVLSANTNTTVSFIIPYVGPSRYWNMKDSSADGGAAEGFFGHVWLHVLAPLRLIGEGTTPTLSISVFAEFVDPEPAGFGLRSTPTPLKVREFTDLVAQSSREQAAKTETGSQDDKFVDKSKTFIKSVVTGGAELASEGILEALGKLCSLTDKPTDLSKFDKVLLSNNTSLATGDGLDGCDPLAMSINNKVSNDTSLYLTNKDYNLFDNYKRLPAIIKLGSWDGTYTQNQLVFEVPVTPTYVHYRTNVALDRFYEVTPLSNLADKFMFWTGGIKYHLQFFTSKFISGRVVVKWIPDPTNTGVLNNDDFGDTVSHVIDITGDTSYSFTIPYLRQRSWEPVLDYPQAILNPQNTWIGINGQITLSLINPLTIGASSGTPVVYYVLWASGAEDFRVARPRGKVSAYSDGTVPPTLARGGKSLMDNLKLEAQSGIDLSVNTRALFEKPFPSLIDSKGIAYTNVTMGEEVASWPELAKRYTKWTEYNFTANLLHTTTVDPLPTAIGNAYWPYLIKRSFHFYRGSYRLKFQIVQSGAPTVTWIRNKSATADSDDPMGTTGTVSCDNDIRTWMEVQVPFYTNFDMFCQASYLDEQDYRPQVFWTSMRKDTSGTAFAMTVFVWYAVGDDWTFGWPAPPVILSLPPLLKQNSTVNGTRGERK